MRIAIAADEMTGVAPGLPDALSSRGHEVQTHGVFTEGARFDWAWACEAAAREVADGRAEQAVVCCWTGTGASIAANKVAGVRAALCADSATAAGARRW
ncbi:MAG: RpiB/LacA/LacB family sugar-phosphate isomerase, partial [Solirubrobacterales bacterium]